jgi:hypothetical protein
MFIARPPQQRQKNVLRHHTNKFINQLASIANNHCHRAPPFTRIDALEALKTWNFS